LIRQPEKVAMPATAFLGLLVQTRDPLTIAKVTGIVLLVTVFPPASWTAMTGWLVKTVLRAVLPGVVVKTSFLAAPTDTVKLPLVAVVRAAEVAVSV
jgi:hypothetical protein